MPDIHLTDEQITQYRDGVLWNPVVASICDLALHARTAPRSSIASGAPRPPRTKQSAHPSSEELAYFLEGRSVGMAFTKVEAHVAGCRSALPTSRPFENAPTWVAAGGETARMVGRDAGRVEMRCVL